jgi:hypothetical protein
LQLLEQCKGVLTEMVGSSLTDADVTIATDGFSKYISDLGLMFYELINMIHSEDEEAKIKVQIDTCHKRIHELKYLYE